MAKVISKMNFRDGFSAFRRSNYLLTKLEHRIFRETMVGLTRIATGLWLCLGCCLSRLLPEPRTKQGGTSPRSRRSVPGVGRTYVAANRSSWQDSAPPIRPLRTPAATAQGLSLKGPRGPLRLRSGRPRTRYRPSKDGELQRVRKAATLRIQTRWGQAKMFR